MLASLKVILHNPLNGISNKQQQTLNNYDHLTQQIIMQNKLIIWPEAAIPSFCQSNTWLPTVIKTTVSTTSQHSTYRHFNN